MSATGKGNFGGQGGEIIRGGWARFKTQGETHRDQAIKHLESVWLRYSDVLNSLAKESARLDFQTNFDAVTADPLRGLFTSYVTNRTGRWLATMRHGESVRQAHTTLLINNQMVRQLLTLEPRMVAGEMLALLVMKKLQPGVESIPFFKDRWSFEVQRPSPFYAPDSWDQRAPYHADDRPRTSFNWRSAHSKDLSNFFREYIFADSRSPLLDVIDQQKVDQMLNGHRYRHILAWSLFSVQASLNQIWLDPTPPASSTLRIEVPA